MRKYPFLLCSLLAIGLFTCEEEFELPSGDQGWYDASELAILNQVLNLPEQPFNYAHMELPYHYISAVANEADNTPEENEITDMGATLGRVLFYDRNLSVDNTISCASCHKQELAFSDDATFSAGIGGQLTQRNSMTIMNSRFYENGHFFWDERASTLEEQALIPIQDHTEMGIDLEDLEIKLRQLTYYPLLFQKAFGSTEVTSEKIALALSQFMRSVVSVNSRFDVGFAAAGFPEDEEQMPDFPNFTDQENLGMDIFYRGRNGGTCLYCHGSPQHVNDEAKNNGLALNYTDQGKGAITGNPADRALFKVPSLRNIAKTAPYMHDGRFATLIEVVNHYSEGVQDHPNLNFRLKTLDDGAVGTAEVLQLRLTQEEKEALVAFLHTLTDEVVLTDEKYSDPFK